MIYLATYRRDMSTKYFPIDLANILSKSIRAATSEFHSNALTFITSQKRLTRDRLIRCRSLQICLLSPELKNCLRIKIDFCFQKTVK